MLYWGKKFNDRIENSEWRKELRESADKSRAEAEKGDAVHQKSVATKEKKGAGQGSAKKAKKAE